MFAKKLELISTKNIDSLCVGIFQKYKIPKSKLKVMWTDRENNSFQEVGSRLKHGNVLEVLMQLKVTEKILKINDHYIHPASGFIFDPISRKVIARVLNNDGTLNITSSPQNFQVRQLTESDILDCKQWKFDFIIPMNLDKTDTSELEKEIELIHLGDSDSDCDLTNAT